MARKESVKSVCEAGILKGSSKAVLMNSLRKKFDKDDATYEKSIKYYASALHRAGKIDEDAKVKYAGPGKKSSSEKAGKTKKSAPSKRSSTKQTTRKKSVRKSSAKKSTSKASTKKTSAKKSKA